MRAMKPGRGALLLLALALVLVVVAGCSGGDEASTAASVAATAASGQSADQIVKESEARMKQVNSASFTADLAREVQGDTAKMSDPTAKAQLSQAVTFHVEGASRKDPTAVDLTIGLGIAGPEPRVRLVRTAGSRGSSTTARGTRSPAENAKALDEQPVRRGADRAAQEHGRRSSAWGTTVGARWHEDLDGVQVYHVTASPDAAKLTESS